MSDKTKYPALRKISVGKNKIKSKTILSSLVILITLLGLILFSGCSFTLDSLQATFANPTEITDGNITLNTPTDTAPEAEITLTAIPQDIDEITNQHVLTLWVPPQFDPNGETSASALLNNRLDAFISEYPNVEIQVRIKSVSGSGGLLESLTTTSAAAPDALPTLILLNRSSLETASLKGLISPLDERSTVIDDSDWYGYARELAIIQGSVYGLPVAGDAVILVYRPAQFSSTPVDWETLESLQQPVIFPVADPEALFTINLYQSLGGSIQDTQLHPTLDAGLLEIVLQLYENGARSGIFPTWITQYQSDSQAWQSYLDQNANAVITWSSRYLSELPADSSAIPVPNLGDEAYTVADGWMWALADQDPERQVLGIALAEYLVESNFLAEWSPDTGYLPTRPTSLTAVTNQNLKTLLSQIVIASHVRPANDLTSTVGPIVQEAAVQIIKRQTNSVEASVAAAEKLETPEE
ncbi:MAG: extracellular solute-binding protein [Anaerolineaceae bacterium]|nr:extracellular solute-binding protein [Anaerolineaceae bacterium]